ncbi:MAG: CotH kinase family protein [Deltaproteobacteria bacterium]|nr:CotH kinase family protein [Deltaproteobacteria bacterium]
MLLLLACTAGTIDLGTDTPGTADPGGDSAETVPGTDTSVEPDDTGGDEEPEAWPQDCASIYDQDELPTVDLDFPPGGFDDLVSACHSGSQAYHPVDFTWNDETVAAMVRLKGNWSWSCDKLQFVVSFNEVDPDARFHGLRKLVFDAPWYDHTLLHERLAHPLFQRLGLPYSCVNNARVNVDGEYYSLYANLERVDREYLERHFEDPSGNLYQGGSELKTNEDVGDTSRLQALKSATTVDEIAALVDLDEATSEWAAEAVIPALDNYWAGVEINYYLYDHPSRGFLYLPYDLDISFGDSAYTDGSPVWSGVVDADPITWEHTGWRKEVLFEIVLADPEWCEVYVGKVVAAREAYAPELMASQVDEWAAQIEEAWADDPRAWVSARDHAEAVASLREFLVDRAVAVDAWLAEGDHCPARW